MPGVVWQEVAPIRALLPISLSEPPPDVNQLFWRGDATLPAPNGRRQEVVAIVTIVGIATKAIMPKCLTERVTASCRSSRNKRYPVNGGR
jgi:hypothetical protein